MAEDEGVGKQGTGRRDTLLERWDSTPYLRIIAPVLCVAWEAMMFARVVFAETDASLSTPSAQLALFALMAVGCAALFLRYRLPFVSVLFESVACLVASVVGALAYVYVLPLVALYACVARAPRREAAVGATVGVMAVALSAVIDSAVTSPRSPVAALAGIGYPLILAAGVALLSRFRWWRLCEAEDAAQREAERAVEIARAAEARDRALAKSRIAAELHDSVGHDLTAIIALSEGLAGATGDEQLDRAIASINELARSGLADTRRAVRALTGKAGSTAVPSALPGSAPTEKPAERHRWDEIAALLGPVRAAGVTAAFTETGVRPDDPSQAGLAFRVCREGVTNALRHAAGLSRLTASVDHGEDGSADVAIRDDGTPGEGAGDPGTGMGLARLRGEVGESGGTLAAGPVDEGGWCLKAHLPSLTGAGEGGGGSPMATNSGIAWAAASARIPVMIVDDQPETRLGLSLMVRRDPGLLVILDAENGQQAIDRLAQAERLGRGLPAVVLMDVRMPVLDGIDATAAITRRWPQVRVLVLTTYDEDDYAFGGLEAGASGFLLKDVKVGELCRAIRSVADGDAVLTPRITREVLARSVRPIGREEQAASLRHDFRGLTDRERQISGLVAQGLSNAEIAERICVQPASAKRAVTRILAKLGLRDRTQIAVNWYRAGMQG